MQGLLYVLVPAVILGVSWGLRAVVAKTMKEHHEEQMTVKE
ncbi:hypothetical protein [Natranaerofaba carboxydovora]|nr:hypothetical protein [Natranaerofaba carboxydovora]